MAKMKLWNIRSERNITIRELANLSGISKSEINNIENERYSPRLSQLEKLAAALDMGIVDLFDSEYKYAPK
jgi:putative transcriptional regulator|nr:MAG TPA: helix-turn-helix domain protein [Bacteriophage sp.]